MTQQMHNNVRALLERAGVTAVPDDRVRRLEAPVQAALSAAVALAALDYRGHGVYTFHPPDPND
ncbi:MAG: hypothetical protein WD904_12990 [Dehalococcoidia bacterium]